MKPGEVIINNRISSGLLSWIAAGALLCGISAQAQHGHLNAGAVSPDAGAQLLWVNGIVFATNSGYVQNMNYSTSGTWAGYYNSGPTLTSLANSGDSPSPLAALGGAFLNVQITLISAPDGASFAFWDTGSLTPTYVLGVGNSTPLVALSDETLGAGNPGADPFGHIHGRRFSGTLEGDYIVALQLFDTSDYGPGATPLHTPSDVLYVMFRGVAPVVPEPATGVLLGLGSLAFVLARSSRKRF
ncbi:MAG TPA: PEP-CTERM sorting domain-containing protein [Verrucomicrobiota bacterium]|nr:PEP-CTERM sorting domain-containing protein [Verrucomicrobiota bacterium]